MSREYCAQQCSSARYDGHEYTLLYDVGPCSVLQRYRLLVVQFPVRVRTVCTRCILFKFKITKKTTVSCLTLCGQFSNQSAFTIRRDKATPIRPVWIVRCAHSLDRGLLQSVNRLNKQQSGVAVLLLSILVAAWLARGKSSSVCDGRANSRSNSRRQQQ